VPRTEARCLPTRGLRLRARGPPLLLFTENPRRVVLGNQLRSKSIKCLYSVLY
jgi:hypothetical protein